MKRKDTELTRNWSEIFCNERYKEIPSLNGIITDNKEVLEKILSIRIPIYRKNLAEQGIEQYNIETKKYITNISTHNGLDLHLMQYNKVTKKKEVYSPYSSPWYNVFADLLCAHYEFFKKKPVLNFPNTDVEKWNRQLKNHDIPLMNEMLALLRDHWIQSYLYRYKLFQQDNQWIFRAIYPNTENPQERKEEWIGIRWDEVDFQCIDYYYNPWLKHRISIEKDLINVFLQMFIDVNLSVASSVVNLNLKKIADVMYKILEDPQARKDDKADIKLRYEKLEA